MTFVLKEASVQLITVFSIVALGYVIGSIKIKGICLSTAAIFLSGLLFGHFGAQTPAALQTLGLILFLTSIGMSAGPAFVQRLKCNGLAYIALCLATAATGALLCIAIIKLAGVEAPLAVGLMTGAFTTSPGFAAAKEAVSANAEAVSAVAAGYGIIYPLGVVSKVLYIQLVPRWLHADMEHERNLINQEIKTADKPKRELKQLDTWGLFPFSLAVVFGILLGAITLPLPGGGTFALGTAGGPLIAGLLIGHIGHVGCIDLCPNPKLYGPAKEIGLMLFFSGAGVEGGRSLARILSEYGVSLLLYGFILVAVPLAVGFVVFYKCLKLPLLNGLGSITASMTCTPSLAVLVKTAGTDDVAAPYAATYPIALITLALVVQLLVRL